MSAVSVRGLGRTYGSPRRQVTALADVSFDVGAGEVVALLGANGAGKTTLVKIVSTLLLPTTGTVTVLGKDVRTEMAEVRRSIGVVLGGDRGLYGRLSGRENLRFFAMLAGVSRAAARAAIPEMLDRVGLASAADRAVETYSKGMRQRLHIAVGLLPRPRVLLLDEPTVGLDPVEAEALRSSVAALRADGISVLLTSHHLLDVERLADRVVMIERGRVAADLPTPEFAALAGYAAVVTVTVEGAPPRREALRTDSIVVEEVSDLDDRAQIRLRVRSWTGTALADLSAWLGSREVLDMHVRPAQLEEAFAALVASAREGRR